MSVNTVFVPAAAVESHPVYLDSETVRSHHLTRLKDFLYTRSNIPGVGSDPDDWDENIEGCECSNHADDNALCGSSRCPCVRIFGPGYRRSKLDSLASRKDGDGSNQSTLQRPILECGSNCSCSKGDYPRPCANSVVGAGITFPFLIFHDDEKGFGLKCLERIPAGCFVCEYAGEVVGEEEARRRLDEKRKRTRRDLVVDRDRENDSRDGCRSNLSKEGKSSTHFPDSMNYIIVLSETVVDEDDGDDYADEVDDGAETAEKRRKKAKTRRTIVDAEHCSNIGHFINHSCLSNLVMIPVRISRDVPRLALFAKRDIQPMEELTFHYGGDEDAKTKDSGELGDVTCLCQSENCAKTLPFDEVLHGC